MSNNEIWVDHHIIRRPKPKKKRKSFLWLMKIIICDDVFFCIYNLNVDGYLSSCFCKSYIYHQQVVCCVGKLSYKILYELFMSFFHLWTETFICFSFIIFLTFFLKHLKCVVPQNLMVKILIIFLSKLMLSENFIRFFGENSDCLF